MPGNVSSEEGEPGMSSSEVTIAEMMRPQATPLATLGSGILDTLRIPCPIIRADYSWGHMGGCIDNYSHFFFGRGPIGTTCGETSIFSKTAFFQDSMVREMNDFITRNKEKPFFIYWALNSPHYPLQGDAKWREYYKDLPSPRSKYNAFVSTLDDRIGQMLNHLEAMGLSENTLVIFQSDHGHSTEERTFNGGGSAGIYRGAKGAFSKAEYASLPSYPCPASFQKTKFVTNSPPAWIGCRLSPISAGSSYPIGIWMVDPSKDVILSASAPSPHETFYWHLGGQESRWVVAKAIGNCWEIPKTAPTRLL